MTNQELKIIDVDGEAGVALPDSLLQRWGLKLGDDIAFVLEEGRLVLLPPAPPGAPVSDNSA